METVDRVDRKEVPVKVSAMDYGENMRRNSSMKSLQTFICGKQLIVDFFYPISSVTITVVNISTNKVVFWEVYDMPGGATIDLSNEGAGEYQVKFTLPSTCLWGDFSIE